MTGLLKLSKAGKFKKFHSQKNLKKIFKFKVIFN